MLSNYWIWEALRHQGLDLITDDGGRNHQLASIIICWISNTQDLAEGSALRRCVAHPLVSPFHSCFTCQTYLGEPRPVSRHQFFLCVFLWRHFLDADFSSQRVGLSTQQRFSHWATVAGTVDTVCTSMWLSKYTLHTPSGTMGGISLHFFFTPRLTALAL